MPNSPIDQRNSSNNSRIGQGLSNRKSNTRSQTKLKRVPLQEENKNLVSMRNQNSDLELTKNKIATEISLFGECANREEECDNSINLTILNH